MELQVIAENPADFDQPTRIGHARDKAVLRVFHK
jgi:hypothetical protein